MRLFLSKPLVFMSPLTQVPVDSAYHCSKNAVVVDVTLANRTLWILCVSTPAGMIDDIHVMTVMGSTTLVAASAFSFRSISAVNIELLDDVLHHAVLRHLCVPRPSVLHRLGVRLELCRLGLHLQPARCYPQPEPRAWVGPQLGLRARSCSQLAVKLHETFPRPVHPGARRQASSWSRSAIVGQLPCCVNGVCGNVHVMVIMVDIVLVTPGCGGSLTPTRASWSSACCYSITRLSRIVRQRVACLT